MTTAVVTPVRRLVGPSALGRKTVDGALWSGLAFLANKLVILGSSVVVARLLTPAEFGLVAIAMVIVGYVERLSEGGLESAVIAYRGPEQECLDHGLGLSLALGSGFVVAGVLSAPLVAGVFDEPGVEPVVGVLSLLYLSTSVRQLLAGGLARRMQFDRRVGPEVARGATKAVTMIVLAFAGWGVWALTIGHLVGAVVGVMAYWTALATPIRPRFAPDISGPLLRFGGTLSLVSLLGAVVQNADYVMIALRSETGAVGLYSIGYRVPELTVLAVPVMASASLIAGFTRVRHSPPELRAAYLTSLALISAVLCPLGAGLTLVADDVIGVLFGARWVDAAPVLERVGLSAIAFGLGFPFGDAMKATGRASILARIGVARFVFVIPALWFAAGRGLAAVATVHLVAGFVLLAVTTILASSSLSVSYVAQASAVLPSAVAAAFMGLLLVLVKASFDPGLVRLLASVVAGLVGFMAALKFFDRPLLELLYSLARRRSGSVVSSGSLARQPDRS